MAISDIRELGTILSIWAHPDDEAYLCGGTMAMAGIILGVVNLLGWTVWFFFAVVMALL